VPAASGRTLITTLQVLFYNTSLFLRINLEAG